MVSEELLTKLYEVNAIKFGSFKLKSGIISPIYFDFRCIISYPKLLRNVAKEMWQLVEKNFKSGSLDCICGVPFTALPIASTISTMYDIPMLMKRKEAKTYGTGNLVEGVYKRGCKCLIVEDVVTSGLSVYETAKALRDLGIEVSGVVVLLDRQQGGNHNLMKTNIDVQSLIKVDYFLCKALQLKIIDTDCYNHCVDFFKNNQLVNTSLFLSTSYKSLEQRITSTQCAFNKKLMKVMLDKQSNLCVAVDLANSTDVLRIAEQVGPHICLLKTHIDVVDDFDEKFLQSLRCLADKYNFLLFEDRKFADIGATVKLQYKCRHYKINKYFDVVNTHVVSGPNVVDGLYDGRVAEQESACILLAEMSSEGNLFDERVKKSCLELSKKWPNFVSGFICQSRIDTSGDYLHYTPGVTLKSAAQSTESSITKTDGLGQQYKTPKMVIDNGADVIIIGRAITQSDHPKHVAETAQKECFDAFMHRSS